MQRMSFWSAAYEGILTLLGVVFVLGSGILLWMHYNPLRCLRYSYSPMYMSIPYCSFWPFHYEARLEAIGVLFLSGLVLLAASQLKHIFFDLALDKQFKR